MQKLKTQSIHISPSTVEEKIHLEKQLPFDPGNKTGPTIDLYFHELTSKKTTSQRILGFIVGLVLSILFIITFPFIALLIKRDSRHSVIQDMDVPGRRGKIFQLYRYSTDPSHISLLSSFLKKTGLYKLPSVINLWKGDINLIGPQPYPEEICNIWNEEFSDYYKRFSLKPGLLGIAEPMSDPDNLEEVAKALKRELNYILKPSLKKDFKHLFGWYQ